MKQKYLKYFLFLIIGIIFFVPNKVSAVTSSGGYSIQSYDIDMVVNENNTFGITEEIEVYFNEPRHGIFRKIPLKNNITRTDGTTSKNRAQISNISVNKKYTQYKENGYQVIKIGDSQSTVTGKCTYKIKYQYNIGKDPLKDADELYFNLIGDEWDTSINNVNFKIKMPKTFDEKLLGFSTGSKGSTDSSNVSYTVDEKVIEGTVNKTLYARQALTIRLTLPEGYFVGASSSTETYAIIVIAICTICVFIAVVFWFKYGKDDVVIDTVEFYPPEGYNSAEIGFLYKGYSDDKSIISLLIYLANKGYLKIEEIEQTGLFSKSKGFKITKLKEYEENNEVERMFFNGLFSGSKKTVTAADLYDKFYRTLARIKSAINCKENKNRIFETVANGKIKWIVLMIIAIFVLITVKPVIETLGTEVLIFALLFPGIGFSVLIGGLTGAIKMPKWFAVIWGGMFGGIPWSFMVLPALMEEKTYLVTYIVGIIAITALIVFAKILPKRTPYGNKMFGKLKGFKRFLETAEKEQLESLVLQNPEYFYNILPYTYALDVSDVWMKQFETIALQAPNWYDSNSSFDTHRFNTFIGSTMTYAQSAMTSSPSSSSGGSSSSSGGGSSGGGSGRWRRRFLVMAFGWHFGDRLKMFREKCRIVINIIKTHIEM